MRNVQSSTKKSRLIIGATTGVVAVGIAVASGYAMTQHGGSQDSQQQAEVVAVVESEPQAPAPVEEKVPVTVQEAPAPVAPAPKPQKQAGPTAEELREQRRARCAATSKEMLQRILKRGEGSMHDEWRRMSEEYKKQHGFEQPNSYYRYVTQSYQSKLEAMGCREFRS